MATTTYTVGPMPGGSTRWRVLSNGHQVSKHNSKSNALKRARELKDRNDTVTVKDKKGKFQRRL